MADLLPAEYVPFERLVVCGNELTNGKVVLRVNGKAPFLIGKGPEKEIWIWLAVPMSKEMTEWRELVARSIPQNSFVTVTYTKPGELIVRARGQEVLFVERIDESSAAIHRLDLRPVGLRFHGDDNGLMLGTNSLVKNRFTNVDTMVAIGQ